MRHILERFVLGGALRERVLTAEFLRCEQVGCLQRALSIRKIHLLTWYPNDSHTAQSRSPRAIPLSFVNGSLWRTLGAHWLVTWTVWTTSWCVLAYFMLSLSERPRNLLPRRVNLAALEMPEIGESPPTVISTQASTITSTPIDEVSVENQ